MKKILTAVLLSLSLILSSTSLVDAATFNDVSSKHWAYKEISYMVENGLINESSKGTFSPNQSITRIDAARALALAIGAKPSAGFKLNFKDLDVNHESYNHVRALVELGVLNNAEKFNPENNLTRAQMAKILTLGFGLIIDGNQQISFKDVAKGNHFYGYIKTLAEVGITTAGQNGEFNPNGHVSRSHMSAFVHRSVKFNTDLKNGLVSYDKVNKKYVGKLGVGSVANASGLPSAALDTVTLVNQKRASEKLPTLKLDAELSRIAQLKAEDFVKNNYFAHLSPTYGRAGAMLDRFNYSWTAYGENLAYGYKSPAAAVEGWIKSPAHLANIRKSSFTNIGVGYAVKADGTPYWVHLFSRK
ncbi:CAP and S-layer homology domain-containing protein [Sporosarcina sp. CAU 1771]